jgi:hypothetical protein
MRVEIQYMLSIRSSVNSRLTVQSESSSRSLLNEAVIEMTARRGVVQVLNSSGSLVWICPISTRLSDSNSVRGRRMSRSWHEFALNSRSNVSLSSHSLKTPFDRYSLTRLSDTMTVRRTVGSTNGKKNG